MEDIEIITLNIEKRLRNANRIREMGFIERLQSRPVVMLQEAEASLASMAALRKAMPNHEVYTESRGDCLLTMVHKQFNPRMVMRSNCGGAMLIVDARLDGTGSPPIRLLNIYHRGVRQFPALQRVLENSVGMKLVMSGDNNARVGNRCGVGNAPRATQDSVVNTPGKCFSRMWKHFGMELLNGNHPGDLTGKITRRGHTNYTGTVVDHTVVSREAGANICGFRVGGNVGCDHNPMYTTWRPGG